MNILLVSGLSDFGGVEIEVELLAKLARDCGYSVHVLSTSYIKKSSYIYQKLSNEEGIVLDSMTDYFHKTIIGKIFHFLVKVKFFNKGVDFFELDREPYGYRFAKKYRMSFWKNKLGKELIKKSDKVILVGQPLNIFEGLLISAKNENKPLYFRITGTVLSSHISNQLYKIFLSNINIVKKIIVHSKLNKNNILQYLHYNGEIDIIDQFVLEEEEYLSIKKIKKNDDVFIVGTMARFSKEKCIDDIIKAFYLFHINNTNSILYIAGDGEEKESLKKLVIELGIKEKVIFLGYIQDKAKIDFFKTIDVFIISSKFETGPITGVEAMAASLPIISTFVGAMPERLQNIEKDFFYEVGDIEKLSEYIRVIFDMSLDERLKIGEKNRKVYMKYYSKKNILSLYKKSILEDTKGFNL